MASGSVLKSLGAMPTIFFEDHELPPELQARLSYREDDAPPSTPLVPLPPFLQKMREEQAQERAQRAAETNATVATKGG